MIQAVASTPDVTLLLDMEGVIREATVAGSAGTESVEAWLGKPWVETVDRDGGQKVSRIVADARSVGISAFRQITQRFPSGLELPIEYTTVLLGGRAGMLAVGKNLQAVAELQSRLIAAQQAMERDYWKLREIETRYRLLFDASHEAVMLVKVSNLRIVEANPAAAQALGFSTRGSDPAGQDLLALIAPQDRASLSAMLIRVQEHGKAPAIRVHLGDAADACMVRGSLITTEGGPVFMLQLNEAGRRAGPKPPETISAEQMLERSPDGFVVITTDGTIQWANDAFVGFAEVGARTSVIGQRLGRWLSRPGADIGVLLANVQRHRTVRLFSTAVHGELGTDTDVEISASEHPDARLVGLTIRNVSPRLPNSQEGNALFSRLDTVVDQVGKTPLRHLVNDTVSIVEQHYIKAALKLADGNRTAAAKLLGLSRQSLYAKLDRYGIDGESEMSAVYG